MESIISAIILIVKENLFITLASAIGAVVIGLSAFTNAIESLWSFCKKCIRVFKPVEPEWKSDFDKIRRKIIYCNYINQIPVHLHDLREIFIAHDLVKTPSGRKFFEKWLSDMAVYNGIEVLNVYSSEELYSLKEELNGLQL